MVTKILCFYSIHYAMFWGLLSSPLSHFPEGETDFSQPHFLLYPMFPFDQSKVPKHPRPQHSENCTRRCFLWGCVYPTERLGSAGGEEVVGRERKV